MKYNYLFSPDTKIEVMEPDELPRTPDTKSTSSPNSTISPTSSQRRKKTAPARRVPEIPMMLTTVKCEK